MNVWRTLAIGGGAAIVAAGMVNAMTAGPQALAGSNNGAVNTYQQPTPSVMATGLTIRPSAEPTTLAVSAAAPTLKATPLPAECSMPNKCP